MSVLTWPARLSGLRPGSVDMHTHAIDPELTGTTGDGFPSVRRTGATTAQLLLRGRVYREIDERCWSIPARLRDMDAEGVAVQAISPIPVTLCYAEQPTAGGPYARAQNDFLARLVAQAPDRFVALGAVALQDPTAATAELEHCVGELGFAGVEIGTVVADRELTDPAFTPFFEAAAALGAVVFIHPVDQTLDPRLARLGIGFGMGMPSETATAAAALLVHGTLDSSPGAKILLAHAGGALPSVLPRLAKGQLIADTGTPAEKLATTRARRLWCDTLAYDIPGLELAATRFGADHVVLGTDYPFAAREEPAGAVLADLPPAQARAYEQDNVATLLARTGPATASEGQHS